MHHIDEYSLVKCDAPGCVEGVNGPELCSKCVNGTITVRNEPDAKPVRWGRLLIAATLWFGFIGYAIYFAEHHR